MTIIMNPDYPESFDEEQGNLSLIIKPLGEKKEFVLFKDLAQQNQLAKALETQIGLMCALKN